MPSSSARWMIRIESSWSVLPHPPNIIVPRHRGLTRTPVAPSWRCSIAFNLPTGAKEAEARPARTTEAPFGAPVIAFRVTPCSAAAGAGAAVAAGVASAGPHHATAAAIALDRIFERVEERGLADSGSLGCR